MNVWKKDGSAWLVSCDREHAPGEVVTVTKRDGGSKSVILGARVQGLGFLYATAAPARPAAQAVGDLKALMAMFDKARQHLRYPAIELGVPAVPGLTLRLNVAGPKAKVPGSITVLDGDKGEDGRDWFGRILQDGTYQPSNATNGRTEAITSRLAAFAAEPARIAAEHGKLTGRCMFCRIKLSDPRSIAVGYGKTCAGHYGVPWGEAKFTFAATPSTGGETDGALDEQDRRTVRPQDYRS